MRAIPRRSKAILALALAANAIVLGATWGAERSIQTLRWVHDAHLAPSLALSRLDASLKNARAHVSAGYAHDPSLSVSALHQHPITLHTNAIRYSVREARLLWSAYRAAAPEEDAKDLVEAVDKGLTQLIDTALIPSADALDAARYGEAAAAITKTYLNYRSTEAAIERLHTLTEQRVQTTLAAMEEERADWHQRAVLLALVTTAIATTLWLQHRGPTPRA